MQKKFPQIEVLALSLHCRYTTFMNSKPYFWRNRTLFGRLLIYFLIVLIVPLGLFSAYYALIRGRNQERYLTEQTMNLVITDAAKVSSVLESYRHKAYQLSTDPLIVRIMEEDKLDANSHESRDLYQLLFSVMRGDTYLASANIVSNAGRVRVSTHTFPEVYDLRYHGNDWDMNSIISQNANISPTASIVSIRGHRMAENGRQVVASILRRIYDSEGTNLGYLVIDIFAEALSSLVNTERLLSDVLLIDNRDFYATSLVHTDHYGTFDKFPALSQLKGDYSRRTMQTGSSIVSLLPIQGTNLHLAGSVSAAPFQESLDRLLYAFTLTMAVGTLLAMGLSFLFSRSIAQPIRDLAYRMGEVERGNLQTKEVKSRIWEFAQLEHSFNIMVKQIVSLLELTREEQEKLSEAERKALESQMNPHFLFNTLNTIKALARLHGEEDIYTITVKLGKLLRSTIDNHESECTLEQSMALIDSYLTIQRLRFGSKLKVQTYLDPSCASIKTPKLIIQPLVENAIIHGLEPKTGEWTLSVRIVKLSSRVFITIEDNGVGFAKGTLPDDLDELANSTHVGVYNVYRRLFLTYGKQMTFSLTSKVGEGTTVNISFPDDSKERK
ncbi:integral membrane sensor signal transduction histidine kinase [Sphaerochaeta globosa str. Buddy]|uniref:Integral membrane sensor signal transduction histidine kinase n=2 Tax=Sphaerochaeta TaxID=399320 RepID=F0RV54_SPHGB|nr:integral membrane sensor signal transduction histidine kinase [Sphaerochaeta globosa str. Buddy]